MSNAFSFFGSAAALLLTSCGFTITTNNSSTGASTKSTIIKQVEDAGSGPIEKVSKESLFYWLRDRMDLALAVNKRCKEISPKAPAGWRDTPEGRVCEVAGELAAFRGQ